MLAYLKDLEFALRLADRADDLTLAHFTEAQHGDLAVRYKADRSEVTDADVACERLLREEISERYPEDSILGEEFGGDRHDGRLWVVDPIDGTANYLRGVPVWATLIALVIDGAPVLGVVSAPALQRRWWATQGGGAVTRDLGRERGPLTVSKVADLDHAFISFGSLHYWEEADRLDDALRLSSASWRDRSFGDFSPYMLVAEGGMDVACELDVKPYDLAALAPIVTEAGGRFTGITGAGTIWEGDALATNGLLHEGASAVLAARPTTASEE